MIISTFRDLYASIRYEINSDFALEDSLVRLTQPLDNSFIRLSFRSAPAGSVSKKGVRLYRRWPMSIRALRPWNSQIEFSGVLRELHGKTELTGYFRVT